MHSTTFLALIIAIILASASAGPAPGGFVEKSYYPAQRPIPDLSFLPSTPGVFTFPDPYNTKGYRLTTDADPLTETSGYSYWTKINNHKGNDTMYVIVGETGTDIGTILYSINKVTDEVKRVGSLFPLDNYARYANAGMMYWSLEVWNQFYYLNGGKLMKYFIFENRTEVVFESNDFYNNTYLFQPHSSADGMVHSFTLKSAIDYSDIANGVYFVKNNTLRLFTEFEQYYLDECQVDKSGRYLNIKAADENGQRLNIHVDLETGAVGTFRNANGAYGHSDNGYGAICGASGGDLYAMSSFLYDFAGIIARGDENYWQNFTYSFRSENYPNNYGGPNHYSWVNARDPNQVPYSKQFVCGSFGKSSTGYSHDREILCFRPDGSFDTLIVAPIMTYAPDENDSSFYGNAPKAVLDPTGDYIFWTTNLGGTSRLYAVVAQVPWQLLVSEQDYNPTGPFAVPQAPVPQSPMTQSPSKAPAKATIAAANSFYVNVWCVIIVFVATVLMMQ